MLHIRTVCSALCLLSTACVAQEFSSESWNAKFQATYIAQEKAPFTAAYSGPNSLSPERERSHTFTATAFLGARVWPGAELYLDPEAVQGVPLSRLTGLGGFTNGEIQKTAGPTLKLYRARLFLRQSWDLGGERERVESDENQLAGERDKRRIVATVGNLAITDVFDDNSHAHDPRTDFMNWALMTYGAYDYAADARGYSWGAVLEWYHDDWALRVGRFMQPKDSNGLPLDTRILRHYGDQIELEHAHRIGGLDGRARLLAFRNRARMSRYVDALDLAAAEGGTPDINRVRTADRDKVGVGVNIEQAMTRDAGVFMRASWADGKTETYAFTEIDRSLAIGFSAKGQRWGRSEDKVGGATVRNALSSEHRAYLAAGGLGFFIGDGHLNYRPESITETFYSAKVAKGAFLSVDWQRVRNPGYNADRGPANVYGVRLHLEL